MLPVRKRSIYKHFKKLRSVVFVTDEAMNVFELENKRPFYHVRKVAREACVNRHKHGVTVWCQFPTQKTSPSTLYGNFHFSAADYLLENLFVIQTKSLSDEMKGSLFETYLISMSN